ncbi:serine hydrolase domain-containing protein [Streptomyces sp. NPDC002577]
MKPLSLRTSAGAPVALAAVSAVLAMGLAAGPLAAPALAASPTAATAPSHVEHPSADALRAALAGLPDADATAAVIRVGGTDGTWRGSAGVADVRTGRKVLENGLFRAGSTTKVVTAAVVLQLAAEGKIDLDAPVQKYLPGLFTQAFKPISVRQLLNYTSGLQSGASLGESVEEGYPHRFETLTPEEVVASAIAKGPAADPGTVQDYSNIHYTVLGMLIEKVTGDSYEHQAAVRIFRPLGMRHTSFPDGPDPRIHGPHNHGYEEMDGKLVDVTEWNMSDRWAAGDMISTAADLERFLVALFRGQVVPEPQLEEMFTVPDIPGATMGAALERFVIDGREVWGKSGARPGYNTAIAATRDLSTTLVYSVNGTHAKEAGLAIAQRFAFPAFTR